MDNDKLRKFTLFAAMSLLLQEVTSESEARALVVDSELGRVEEIAELLSVGDDMPPEFIPLVKQMFRETLENLLEKGANA
ncbi:hypothetical protein LOZ80_15130 [Paenibacillus sp. HWE-109]|uniref:hypothetical protein n=1 Tax=Paenibacillus sp. HWE-109 TaxID=1306526 RepID=UPI001EE0EF32|nr:hypothetical protein [Paenibacillus sp. HWE-109]UKS30193.1 hypothetical protein LOZ80_15130 [Paenibacillus sp. HWE-109]